VVTCSAAGTFSSPSCTDPAFNSFLTSIPWFTANNWQDYLYYQLSRATPTLTVGSRTGVQALLAATGKPIATAPYAVSKGSAQSRPSCSANDYLDSVENANADLVFDATNTARSSKYNDQVFIVAP
jgi:hypothetical protein